MSALLLKAAEGVLALERLRLDQFRKWPMVLGEIVRSTSEIFDRCCQRIDAESVVERSVNLFKSYWAVVCFRSRTVRRTDDLPGTKATPSQKRARHIGPVIPARLRIDLWSTAKLTPDNHGHIFVETAVVDLLNASTNRLAARNCCINRGAPSP